MSANGWSIAAGAIPLGLFVLLAGVGGILGIANEVNSDRREHNERHKGRPSLYPNHVDRELVNVPRLIVAWCVLIVVATIAISFAAYQSLVWDCENGTRNSQCRPEDSVTRTELDLDLNVDGGS